MLDEVINVIIENVDDGSDINITSETSFVDDLGMSSLDFFAMTNELEAKYGINISERQLQKIFTVGDLVGLLERMSIKC